MTKLTKKVALSYAVAALTDSEFKTEFSHDEIVAKLNEMIENLDKKVGGEKKPTEQQVANMGYKADILNYLVGREPQTATDILKGVPAFANSNMTNQRVSALLRQLILDGKVQKDTVKGKAYFKAVEGE